MSQTLEQTSIEAANGEASTEPKVDRKIPWWFWLFVAASIMVFVGFFLTFAIGVSSGTVD